MNLVESTPFDQYTRQKIVAKILHTFREGGTKKLKLIDVGGYKGNTKYFLPEADVTVADMFDVKEKNYVKASGLKLPFEADAFDFALSYDVLEHIAAKDRKKFLKESLRVARRGVIVCAPHATPSNKMAEHDLNELYRTVMGNSHRWLQEHIDNKLPEFDALGALAEAEGLHILNLYSNDIHLWMLMQGALFTNERYNDAAEKLISLNTYYNQHFDLDIGVTPDNAYRQVLIIVKEKSDYERLRRAFTDVAPIDKRHQVEVISRILAFYTSLLSIREDRQNRRIEELQKQNENLSIRLEKITNTKTWQYLSKAAHAKNKITKLNR